MECKFCNLQDTQKLWANPELDSFSKCVLQVLLNHRNARTGFCNPSFTTIAREASVAIRTAQNRIRDLVKSGIVRIVAKGGRLGSNCYEVSIPEIPGYPQPVDNFEEEVDVAHPVPVCAGNERTACVGSTHLKAEAPAPRAPEPIKNNKNINTHMASPSSDLFGDAVENPAEKPETNKAAKAPALELMPFEELPGEWRGYAEQVAPGLDPVAVFAAFRFYFRQGKGSRIRRSVRGWASSWQGWVRRDAERNSYRPAQSQSQAPAAAASGSAPAQVTKRTQIWSDFDKIDYRNDPFRF